MVKDEEFNPLRENKPFAPFDVVMERLAVALGQRDFRKASLARILGISRASVDDYKKRDYIPPQIILNLCIQEGLNPLYIATGKGPTKAQALHNVEQSQPEDGRTSKPSKEDTEGMNLIFKDVKKILEAGPPEVQREFYRAIDRALAQIQTEKKKIKHA